MAATGTSDPPTPHPPAIGPRQHRGIGRFRRRDVLVALALVVVALRLRSVLAVHEVWGAMPDSAGYRSPDGGGASGLVSLTGAAVRSWTVPAIYALAPSDGLRAALQVLVSIAAWTTLAAVVAREVRRPGLAVAAFAGVLALSCSWGVISWDLAILAESFALSFGVALVAAWIVHLRRPTWASAGAVVALSVLWLFTRVQHAPAVALGAVVAIVVALAGRRARRVQAALAAGLVLVAAWGAATVGPGDRGYAARAPAHVSLFAETFALNLRFTILPDPEATAWFRDAGMPEPIGLEPYHRSTIHEDAWESWPTFFDAYRADDDLLAWVERDGRSTFARWVLSHPGDVGGRFAADLGDVLVPPASSLGYAFPEPVLPGPIAAVVAPEAGPARISPVVPLLAAATVAAVVRRRWPPNRRLAGVGAVLVVTALGGLFLAWLGSPVEYARHAVPFGVAAVLGALLVLVAALDRAAPPPEATDGTVGGLRLGGSPP